MQNFNQTQWLLRRALALSAVVALIVSVLVIGFSRPEPPAPVGDPSMGAKADPFSPMPRQDLDTLYHQAWQSVRDNYVDPDRLKDWSSWERRFDGKIKTERQLGEAIDEMLGSLSDKRTTYVTVKHLREYEQGVSGRVIGIGITINDELEIKSVMTGKPAERAGIKTGDQIIAIGDTNVMGMPMAKVVTLIRGEGKEGTNLVVWVARDQKPVKFELKRELVHTIDAVRANSMYGPYFDPVSGNSIRIDNLRSDNVAGEVAAKIEELNKKGATAIVLDLRGLHGGSGETAARVAAMFMADGVIAQSRERVDGKIETSTYAIRQGKLVIERSRDGIDLAPTVLDAPVNLFKGTLVVIDDDKTAGASEIVIAALKEGKRAEVVGMTTSGKGVGQRSVYLNGKHALRVSTIRYFSPSGKEFDGVGVEPDLKVEAKDRASIFEKGMSRLQEIAPKPKPKEAAPTPATEPADKHK